MLIVSIDPGKTTGWACYNSEHNTTAAGECRSLADITKVLDAFDPDTVVLEEYRLFSFRANEQSWSNMPAAEVVGVVTLWCKNNSIPLHKQTPGIRITVPDSWLKALCLWDITRGLPHARDAARHLAAYLGRKQREVLLETIHKYGRGNLDESVRDC